MCGRPIFQWNTLSTWEMPDPWAGLEWSLCECWNMSTSDMAARLYTEHGQPLDTLHPSKPRDQSVTKADTKTTLSKLMPNPNTYNHVLPELRKHNTQDILAISIFLYGLVCRMNGGHRLTQDSAAIATGGRTWCCYHCPESARILDKESENKACVTRVVDCEFYEERAVSKSHSRSLF
jgi:hypothetical protein